MGSRTSADELILDSPAATLAWGKRLGRYLRSGDVVGLIGDLGSGKTTLIQGIASGWGFRGGVSSPTFALAHEYSSRKGLLIHMDLYRLKSAELGAFPVEDYFGTNACVIEWADRIRDRWPKHVLALHLDILSETTRRLVVNPRSAAWHRRLQFLRS